MYRQRELGLRGGCVFVPIALFQSFAGAPESGAKREMFVRIPESEEQTADFVGALTSRADDVQGGGHVGMTRLHALEQDALELPAVSGAVGVDSAPAAIERGARLGQVRRAQSRVRGANRQAQRQQPRGFIAALQADVGKDNSVAAQPACRAKLGYARDVGIRRAIQTTPKLRPNGC